MNFENFKKQFNESQENTVTELNNYLAGLKAPSTQFPNENYNFPWNVLQSFLEEDELNYRRATKSFSKDNKPVTRNKNEQPEQNEQDEMLLSMVKKAHAKKNNDNTAITIRIPKILNARIDECVKNSTYTKNQFIIDALEYTLKAMNNF